MKVYSVSTGEYSDYKVLGLFSKKEDAEEMCKIQELSSKWSTPFVEEFGLDEGLEILHKGLKIFFGRISKEGVVGDVELWGYIGDIGSFGFDNRGDLYMTMMAKDEKHVAKILSEKRAELLANNLWEREEQL